MLKQDGCHLCRQSRLLQLNHVSHSARKVIFGYIEQAMTHPTNKLGENFLIIKLAVRNDAHQNVENTAEIFSWEAVATQNLFYFLHEKLVELRIHSVIEDVAYVWENLKKTDHI